MEKHLKQKRQDQADPEAHHVEPQPCATPAATARRST